VLASKNRLVATASEQKNPRDLSPAGDATNKKGIVHFNMEIANRI
jgi:hypothetical protein